MAEKAPAEMEEKDPREKSVMEINPGRKRASQNWEWPPESTSTGKPGQMGVDMANCVCVQKVVCDLCWGSLVEQQRQRLKPSSDCLRNTVDCYFKKLPDEGME